MLLIHPVQTPEEQKSLCSLCGIPYRPGTFCYKAYEGTADEEQTLLGVCQFEPGNPGFFYDLSSPPGVSDWEALFIMGRQTLNFMEQCGTKEAVVPAEGSVSPEWARKIGFAEEGGVFRFSLTGFFESPCKKCTGENG
ncbi:MAG: hypothetical protein II719_04995 [Clostridia bacterium]|nr:hypothetical protein [Clostridia bacterium]